MYQLTFLQIPKRELHHFSDASMHGYCQCSYLSIYIHYICPGYKSSVTTIKVTTIPRLELTASDVSVAASNTLKEELGFTDIDE